MERQPEGMEHTKHLWRVLLIVIVLLIASVVARHFMIPESFGQTGFYRHASLLEYMRVTPVHGGDRACAKCHADQQKSHDEDGHASVSCETCHGPLASHVRAGEKTGDMAVEKTYRLCAICHQKVLGRPEGFPQVDLRAHLSEIIGEGPIPEKACKLCHDPHAPAKK